MPTEQSAWIDWTRALDLEERRALASTAPASRDELERGRAELERWRSEPSFAEGFSFAQRSDAEHLDDHEWAQMLGASAATLAARSSARPHWVAELERATAEPAEPIETWLGSQSALRQRPSIGLLNLCASSIGAFRRRLEHEIATRAYRVSTAVVDDFVDALAARLHRRVARALVLELHAARYEQRLEGDDPRSRFEHFARSLGECAVAREIWSRHPVLARRVIEHVQRSGDAALEFLGHLANDRAALDAAGLVPAQAALESVELGRGDLHRGARAVAVAHFGGATRAVYKPRSLALDRRFMEWIRWTARRGLSTPLAEFAVLDLGDHGWVEFIEPRELGDLDAARRFHRRLGVLLAFAHVADATDLHFENLIAHGEFPTPIDLETFFHPRPPVPRIGDATRRAVHLRLAGSVLRTGLLPASGAARDDLPAFDVSGLSGGGEALAPDEVLHWEFEGTDLMHASKRKVRIGSGSHRARFAGNELDPQEFVDDLAAGFRETIELAHAHRGELCAVDGALTGFAGVEARAVLRPTRAYGLLLEECDHPDLTGDALELERFLERLWVGLDVAPHLAPVVRHERRDLTRGDIPYFRTPVGSRALIAANGERLEEFWPSNAVEIVRAKLEGLDRIEGERQLAWITGSLAAAKSSTADLRWPSYSASTPRLEPPIAALETRALAWARAIGEQLARDALPIDDLADGEQRASWVGWTFVRERWTLDALPADVYSGTAGVAIFLAELARETGEARFAELARAAFVCSEEALSRSTAAPIGAFNGRAGAIYAAARLARALDRGAVLARAREHAAPIAAGLAADRDLDLIGGAAGIALAALAAERAETACNLDRWSGWLELARSACEHLRATAIDAPDGVGWRTRIAGERVSAGLSHGASGIALALVRAGNRLDDPELVELARAAARAENRLYDTARRNWLEPGNAIADPQLDVEDATLMCAWCYGAPGVALARLELLECDGDSRWREDLALALDTTEREGFGRNHCLCHGATGNALVLQQVARASGDGAAARRARAHFAGVLDSFERDGLLCGMPRGVDSPALMNGLAGIGLALLQFARPERVASVLTLEPPR